MWIVLAICLLGLIGIAKGNWRWTDWDRELRFERRTLDLGHATVRIQSRHPTHYSCAQWMFGCSLLLTLTLSEHLLHLTMSLLKSLKCLCLYPIVSKLRKKFISLGVLPSSVVNSGLQPSSAASLLCAISCLKTGATDKNFLWLKTAPW